MIHDGQGKNVGRATEIARPTRPVPGAGGYPPPAAGAGREPIYSAGAGSASIAAGGRASTSA